MSHDESNDNFSSGRSLADQLDELDVDVSESEESSSDGNETEQNASGETSEQAPQQSASAPEPEPEPPQKSDEELFDEVFESLSREDISRGKYGGGFQPPEHVREELEKRSEQLGELDDAARSEASSDSEASLRRDQQTPQSEEEAREEIQRRRDQLQFQRYVGDVERTKTDPKYGRSVDPPDVDKYFEERKPKQTYGRTADDLVTPPLSKDGKSLHHVPPLDDEQQKFRNRFEAWSMNHDTPELNVRGEGLDDAMNKLGLFIQHCVEEKQLFARIIHGKGKKSDGLPVLKLNILEWLEGRGIRYVDGYIPERSFGGDYGSLIVGLRF